MSRPLVTIEWSDTAKQALARKRAKKKIRKDRDSRPDRD